MKLTSTFKVAACAAAMALASAKTTLKSAANPSGCSMATDQFVTCANSFHFDNQGCNRWATNADPSSSISSGCSALANDAQCVYQLAVFCTAPANVQKSGYQYYTVSKALLANYRPTTWKQTTWVATTPTWTTVVGTTALSPAPWNNNPGADAGDDAGGGDDGGDDAGDGGDDRKLRTTRHLRGSIYCRFGMTRFCWIFCAMFTLRLFTLVGRLWPYGAIRQHNLHV